MREFLKSMYTKIFAYFLKITLEIFPEYSCLVYFFKYVCDAIEETVTKSENVILRKRDQN